jgi:hypothetical protein
MQRKHLRLDSQQMNRTTIPSARAHHSMTPAPTTSTVADGRPPSRLASAASCAADSRSEAGVAPARPRTMKRVRPTPSLQVAAAWGEWRCEQGGEQAAPSRCSPLKRRKPAATHTEATPSLVCVSQEAHGVPRSPHA